MDIWSRSSSGTVMLDVPPPAIDLDLGCKNDKFDEKQDQGDDEEIATREKLVDMFKGSGEKRSEEEEEEEHF